MAILLTMMPLAGASFSLDTPSMPAEDEEEYEQAPPDAGALAEPLMGQTSSGSYENCPKQSDPSAISLLDVYYLKEDATSGTASIWAETNGLEGLQTGWTPCGYYDPPVPPDKQVTSFKPSRSIPL